MRFADEAFCDSESFLAVSSSFEDPPNKGNRALKSQSRTFTDHLLRGLFVLLSPFRHMQFFPSIPLRGGLFDRGFPPSGDGGAGEGPNPEVEQNSLKRNSQKDRTKSLVSS